LKVIALLIAKHPYALLENVCSLCNTTSKYLAANQKKNTVWELLVPYLIIDIGLNVTF